MLANLNHWLAKRWLRRRQIKLSHGIRTIPRGSRLTLEEGCAINVAVMRFSELQIGAMTYIRSGGELLNVSEIGRFCSISNNVVIGQEKGAQAHPLNWVSTHPFQMEADVVPPPRQEIASTCIGHDVWIGRDVMIMEGVRVGTGAVIASRSLVTRDVPDYAIVAGSPARVLRYRHPPELASRLLASRWWEADIRSLHRLPLGDIEQFLQLINELPKANHFSCVLTRTAWKSSEAAS